MFNLRTASAYIRSECWAKFVMAKCSSRTHCGGLRIKCIGTKTFWPPSIQVWMKTCTSSCSATMKALSLTIQETPWRSRIHLWHSGNCYLLSIPVQDRLPGGALLPMLHSTEHPGIGSPGASWMGYKVDETKKIKKKNTTKDGSKKGNSH